MRTVTRWQDWVFTANAAEVYVQTLPGTHSEGRAAVPARLSSAGRLAGPLRTGCERLAAPKGSLSCTKGVRPLPSTTAVQELRDWFRGKGNFRSSSVSMATLMGLVPQLAKPCASMALTDRGAALLSYSAQCLHAAWPHPKNSTNIAKSAS